MIILLMGPQGSGKGTQGELLSEKLGIPLIGAGQLLRDEIATGSEMGKQIHEIINVNGELVPPDMISKMIRMRLERDDAEMGALIDGYPRDAEQVRLMFEQFTPDMAIVLDLDDDTAVERLSTRRICPNGHVYNVVTNPPKQEGVCDEDGEQLIHREDDQEKQIRVRLGWHKERTEPVIATIAERGVRVERIDADGSIEEVTEQLLVLLKN